MSTSSHPDDESRAAEVMAETARPEPCACGHDHHDHEHDHGETCACGHDHHDHHHHDHDAVENLKGEPRVIDRAGNYTPESGVKITAIRGFHDDAGGSKRGETLLFLIEAEGLRIVHLGDLGCALNAEQLETLKGPDVLMIPVGGLYTIDAKQAG